MLQKTLVSPLDSKIKPVNPKGNKPWIFVGRTDAEAETLILWPPDANSELNGKGPDDRKDRGQEKKGETEDEMVGQPHQLNGYEFGQTPGDGEEQPSMLHSMGFQRARHNSDCTTTDTSKLWFSSSLSPRVWGVYK